MILPTLYKKTQTGKVQVYSISTEGNKIITVQGQQDGKKQTHTLFTKAMNTGRANATTPERQAEIEAEAKWTKKKNKDYFLTVEEALEEHTTSNEGGYTPMLAQSYNKRSNYLKFPCLVQPKLDGLRCVATKDNNKIQLWFRSGKEITTMGHIVKDLECIMREGDIFDGELYIHGEDFNSFTGDIRRDKDINKERAEKVEYHVYDFPRARGLVEKDKFIDRLHSVNGIWGGSIKPVATIKVNSFEEAMGIYKEFIDEGYEGIMFRNIDSPYEQKRSNNLLKYKEFIDDEFIITGFLEGKGKLRGHIGSFICKVEKGRTLTDLGGKEVIVPEEGEVKAKMKGDTKYLKELFNNPDQCIGKPLTIQYQNLSEEGIPRFPVALRIRFDI